MFYRKIFIGLSFVFLTFVYPNNAKAWSDSQLPPGMQEVAGRDRILVNVFAEKFLNKGYKQYDDRDIEDVLPGRRSGIKHKTRLEEPAFWFVFSWYNWKGLFMGKTFDLYSFGYFKGSPYRKILDENKLGPNMNNWRIGIDTYMRCVNKNGYKRSVVEGSCKMTKEFLAKTFVRAGGKDESEWEKLTNAIESQQINNFVKEGDR